MRKFSSVLISMVMILAMTLAMAAPAFAVTEFVQSIEEKPSPDIVIVDKDEEGNIIGYVVDKDGKIIDIIYDGDIIVTPIAEIDEADIPQEAKDLLKQVYEELTSSEGSLEEVEGLLEKVKEILGEDADLGNIILRDLFDITVLDEEIEAYLEDGNFMKLTFKVNVEDGEFFEVISYLEGWKLAYDVTVNDDGTVTVLVGHEGPLAFLIADKTNSEAETPKTGDNGKVIMWAGIGIVAAVLLVVLAKKRKDEE